MKNFVTILTTIILITVLVGCEKEKIDYRDKYLGDYQITYHYSYWNINGATYDTTITYNGEIKYGNAGSIKIDWHDDSESEFEVSEYGEITKCNSSIGIIDQKKFSLSYTDDLCSLGPLGSSYTIKLTGNKQ